MHAMEYNRPPSMTRRRLTKKFDADAVALVLDEDGGLAPTQAARHLGIGGRTWKTGFARLSSTGAKHPSWLPRNGSSWRLPIGASRVG